MNPLTVFLASALEISVIYTLTVILDSKTNKLSIINTLCFLLSAAGLSTLLDQLMVPGQFIFMLIFYMAAFCLIKRSFIFNYISDVLIANITLFASQYITTVLLSFFGLNIMNNSHFMFLCLGVFLIISMILYKIRAIDTFLDRHYRSSRKTILAIVISAAICISAVLILWDHYQYLFWNNIVSITIILAITLIFNSITFIILLGKQKQKQKIEAYKEYGRYLSDLTLELERKQHEYKNELNTIIGLAEVDYNGNGLQDIISYANTLLTDETSSDRNRYICDDALIAAVLDRIQKKAQDLDISFDFTISDRFSGYRIPSSELAELINNLISNAFEYVETLEGDREVCLELNENKLMVYNTVDEEFDVLTLSDFGKERRSSKGCNRGCGSLNIMDIIRRNDGILDISMENGILIFTVVFEGEHV